MALGGQIQCKSPNRRVFPLFTPRDADKMFGEVRVELEDLDRFTMALGFDIRVQRNRRIAERRPHVRGTPGPHAARILAPCHVADVMPFVLYLPVIADVTQKGLHIGLIRRKARHAVHHVDRPGPVTGPLAGDFKALLETLLRVTPGQ